VIQDPDDLPAGFSLPPDRVKPWGTGQAVMAARYAINTPFAVINADDFYGRESYRLIVEYLENNPGNSNYCMVGYILKNTLSDHGSVSRGVCLFDEDHYMNKIQEITNIERRQDLIGFVDETDNFKELDANTLVSMNIWGFQPGLFQKLQQDFSVFLEGNIDKPKAEFLLPEVINEMVSAELATVKMLETDFNWFGVTYQEDRPATVEKINELVNTGEYPAKLWK
jgi:hypothetical protein